VHVLLGGALDQLLGKALAGEDQQLGVLASMSLPSVIRLGNRGVGPIIGCTMNAAAQHPHAVSAFWWAD
jgi:hypothetical protein